MKGDFHAPFRGSPGLKCPGRPDYAFDAWMARTYPAVTFERYCDDAVVHCRSKAQAEFIRDKIAARLAECGLELHPVKTRIVYCKDSGAPARSSMSSSRSWGTHSGRGWPKARLGISLSASRLRSAVTRWSGFAMRSEAGAFTGAAT